MLFGFDGWLQDWLADHNGLGPPGSMLFIVLVSICLSLITATVTKVLIDVKKLRKYTEQIKEWNKKRAEAIKKADKKLFIKVKRKEKYIQRLQREMMGMQFKPMLVFMLPFILIFFLLRTVFENDIVVHLPFRMIWDLGGDVENLPGGDRTITGMHFVGWYIMSSFAFGSLIQKALGARRGLGGLGMR
ncbi:MAG: EMC3/TMCO1 family protein [Asgard group archaeon]